MMDIFKMFGKMKDVQNKAKEIKTLMCTLKATGESGAGLVKVTVNGEKRVLSIDIDISLLNTKDKVVLQDLIVAAINMAIGNIEAKIKDTLQNNYKEIFEGFPINLDSLF